MVRLSNIVAGMLAIFALSSEATALTVTTDPKGAPESIAATPDGGLILGSW